MQFLQEQVAVGNKIQSVEDLEKLICAYNITRDTVSEYHQECRRKTYYEDSSDSQNSIQGSMSGYQECVGEEQHQQRKFTQTFTLPGMITPIKKSRPNECTRR